MADLDDFFAKKDRKKTKVKKFATPDELAKKSEDTAKKNEPKTRCKEPVPSLQSATQSDCVDTENADQVNAVTATVATAVAEEDEWRDFEEEGRKDYTGLKIQNIEINDDDYYSGSDGDGGDGDGEDGDNEKGAWKKVSAPEGGAAAAASKSNSSKSADATDTAKKGLSASATGRYISPALRQQQLLAPIRLKKDALPDISNEELFPTLGDAKKEELRKKKNEPAFEEVKSGARFQRSSDLPTNAPVSIGNRYSGLADS